MLGPSGRSVFVSRDYLTFSAAHFAQLDGAKSEPLHGHNYSVRLEIAGVVDEAGYLIDFGVLKEILRGLTRPLNHRVLLPAESGRVAINTSGPCLEVTADGRRYSFPAEDAVILPIQNTTVELLAEYLLGQLVQELNAKRARWERASMRIEESPGQGAEITIDGQAASAR